MKLGLSGRLTQATIRSPLIVKLTAADSGKYLEEWFGPVAFVIATRDTAESLAIAARTAFSSSSRSTDTATGACDGCERRPVAASIVGTSVRCARAVITVGVPAASARSHEADVSPAVGQRRHMQASAAVKHAAI